ncbi:hypothetical protein F5Y04DRAFT_2516 [Hypomontagnella monticulosa]|nr:hypothetical protein F5Y04DRAFT_2516 [Hypomontagnella monticulosa]
MATASSQQPANLANNQSTMPARASSTTAQQLSESPAPALTVPSPSLATPTMNGATNHIIPSDGDLRMYPRDGRVRNPVPSKLKDVTDRMKGNFSVMHMDVASHRASEGRDAAAKRTSESTALQAKLAQTDTYVSHQRRANYPRPPGLKQFTSPKKSTSVEAEPVLVTDTAPLRPLTVAETKTEQARLLTLLRTLPPNTVVDQLCKALAFFGGIPDAPPPADGKFPESAEANGSGSLFVGWIAEIFPDLGNPRRRVSTIPPAPALSQRRPRGRPKGSKASKSRSDKGIKKGTKGTANRTQELQDDSWIDVDDSVLELNGDEDLVEGGEILENPLSTPPRVTDGGQFSNTPATGSTGGFKSINDATPIAPGSSTKRRGRPKGSKNRPKDNPGSQQATQPAESAHTNANVSHPADHVSAIPVPPKVTPVPVPTPMLGGEQPKKKANAGRPKGSKNRPKPANEQAGQETTSGQQQTPDLVNHQTGHMTTTGPFTGGATTSSLLDGGVPQNDQRTQQPHSSTALNSQVPTPQVKESTIVGKKRKRQSAPAGSTNPPVEGASDGINGGGSMPQQAQSSIPQSTQTPIPQTQPSANQPIQQSTISSNTAPSAKRSRKSQESGALQAGKRSTPNSMGSKNSAPSATAAIDSSIQTSQVTASPQNQTQAEGLEAHYERIAALQNRTDQVQGNANRSQKQQHQASAPVGNTISPAPAEGLEAHYERFTSLQNRQENARQPTTNRQQMQPQAVQTASPVPSQASKAPQMPSTLASHQQTRPSQSYYPQTQTLGPSYNTQASAYSTNQRQPQHMGTGSPGTSLVQHMTNSPQFGAQSNSPLMQGENNYRGSPSLVHNNTGYPPRRTTSASPLDNNYRAPGHAVSNHSPHFGARQPPTTTHSTSHSTMPSSFAPFADSSFLDIQSLDSGNSHGGMGLGSGSYGLGGSGVPTQQRTSGSSAASLYSSATGMNNNYLSSNVGRTTQNRWPS